MFSSAELGVSQSLIDTYEPGDLRLPLTIKTSFIAQDGQPDQAKFFVKFRAEKESFDPAVTTD
ncbi:hypothetical protein [Chryseobacterium indoltheticum]|uniref:hypothetical protein n=1 Tax=Chryseobacterium indoltheticum TaxID=254 RepID=UPI003F49279D